MIWPKIDEIMNPIDRERNAPATENRTPGARRKAAGEKPGKRRWSKEQIRSARRTELPSLLKKRGYHLRVKSNENYLVEDEGDLVVKNSYWVWESRELKGNAIDFFVLVECRSFNEAMEILTGDG
jgi:hypothetical protein